ncbi:multidrug effflux MFS transporter [Kineococcus sp. R86509]|uniref:multidrug effflux MFS transporter n=1 Tax=Kineococcus sp. R86509 TaxID=3093851 RepID=UPI0036D32224
MTTPALDSASDTARSQRTRLLVLTALVALGPLTVDLYLPAFPALQVDLRTSPAAVQLTLTATTLGLAMGQLVAGPLSDTIGRRRPLLVATAVHVAASVGVASAPDITWVLVFRFLQGMGSAGGAVVTMALVRDLFAGHLFVRAMARLALVTGLAPVVAPALGSQLLHLVHWRGLFVCVAAFGLFAFVLAATALRESLPLARRGSGNLRAVADRYRQVLSDRSFVGVALIGGMMVSGVFAYMTSSSFLLQQVYDLGANGYSAVFAANALAFVLGTQIGARLLARLAPRTLLSWTLPLLAGAGFSVAITDRFGYGLTALVTCTVVFHLAAGASGPCFGVIGMARHAGRAGTAAALLGAANFGLAGVLSPVVGAIGVDSAQPVGVTMGLVGTSAVVVLVLLVRPGRAEREQMTT